MISRRLVSFPLIAAFVYFSTCAAADSTPPQPQVCAAMESLGESLRAGDSSGFYFVNTLGREFPIPNFLLVTPVTNKFSNFSASALGKFDGVSPRSQLNNCDWKIHMDFGSYENLDEFVGGLEAYKNKAIVSYQLGELSVLVSKHPGTPLYSVVVYDETDSISIKTDSVDNVLWLLHLSDAFKL